MCGAKPGTPWLCLVLRVTLTLAALLFLAAGAPAQTTIISEGFEGAFPNTWSTGDLNPNNGLVYWKDEYNTFGSVTAHSGSWKGYCAGISNGVPVTVAGYANNQQAYMSKPMVLTGYTGANLSFWYNIPSIESYDYFRVYVNNTLLFNTDAATVTTNAGGWELVTLPLNGYLSGTNTLKFEFDSDFSVTYEGVYLDDILVRGANQPFVASLQSLQNINYIGYVLSGNPIWSNIVAQTTFSLENFTGANSVYTNVLSFRLINTNGNTVSPLYDIGGQATNGGYSYNITNLIPIAAGTNFLVTNTADLTPAAWLSQFTQYYVECRMFTNGVLAQTLTTAPATYYDFTNAVSGDNALNGLLNFTNNAWSRTYAVTTIPGQNTFETTVGYEIRRFDDFAAAQAAASVPVVFNCTLRDNLGNVVPLVSSNLVFYDTVTNHNYFFSIPIPSFQAAGHVLDLQPAGQLDSVNKTYSLTVALANTNDPVSGQVIAANTLVTTTNELLHFDGNLYFGNVGTILTGLAGAPPVNLPSGGSIATVLSSPGGYVTLQANHTYASAGFLNVVLVASGDAFVTSGNVTLNAPSPDADSVALVNFTRGPVTLTPVGGTCDFKVTLPTGFGYRLNDTSNLVVSPFLSFTGVTLSAALDPANDLNYLPGVPIFAAEETKPVWLAIDHILWHVSQGTFDIGSGTVGAFFTATNEYVFLNSNATNLVSPGTMGDKHANDKYWMSLNAADAPTLRPDPQSNALLSTTFHYGPGYFFAHFPYNTLFIWNGAGVMKDVDDLAVPGSQLSGASPVHVQYNRDCTDIGCGGGAGFAAPGITPDGSVFNFTADGGLIATGPTLSTVNLQWGWIPGADYAQQAFGFTNGVLHMPGDFLRGDQNLMTPDQGPSTILLSGFAGTNLNYVERPLSKAYTAGLADYAGLNFRCAADSLHPARSTIADETNINWSLTGRSKYYIRYGGVSGIHEAVAGTFPTNLVLWGYQFTFSNYGLSYLDSQNKDSLTDGQISLHGPANFVQAFLDMKFSCLGAPTSGDVPPNDPFKVMSYWGADFKTHSITFQGNGSCSPADGYLVLGIEGYASHVTKALYGQVGFFAGGDQIPATFGLAGVTSRLKMPNTFPMDGANGTSYTFTPAEDAYYNTYSNAMNLSPQPPGWINIFGKLKVPFFEDLQLHWQTSCHTNGVQASNSLIHLSGGWPRPGTTNPNYGWNDGSGRTPFETNLFDPGNAGWPGVAGGVASVDLYRANTVQQFHPRAQKLWLGVVDFDYPLAWDPSLRSFTSYQPTTNNLLVVSAQHQVKYMDAYHAELDFGAQYSGLPQINLANIAFTALDQATGVSDAIIKTATQPINDALNTGMDQMNQMLNAQMKDLMDGVFDKTINPIIDSYYNSLSNQWANTWNTLTPAQKQLFAASAYTNGLNFF